MKRFALFLILVFPVLAARTTVTGTLQLANGSFCSGTLTISNPPFTNLDGFFAGGSFTTPINAATGSFSVSLEPGPYYTVTYVTAPSGCTPPTEFWSVPISATPVDIALVRTTTPPPPLPNTLPLSGLQQSGATIGQVPVWNGTNYAPGAGGGGGAIIPNTTSALKGDGAGNALAVTGTGSNCVHVDGSSAICTTGSGDVVGPSSATDNAITRYDGPTGKLIQNSAATVDDSGNVTANSFAGSDTSHSGGSYYQGLTSGGVMIAAADVAGTAIVYVLPSTNGVSGQFLEDNGVATCPTLIAGSPSVCHQLIWAAGGGGGSGCIPTSTAGKILVDDGAGGCTSTTPTISGSTITASLTGHASLDVPTSTTLTGGAGIAAIGDLSTNRTIATASGEADFLASGALTCGAATQGKMQVHTTPLQYCDNAATPTLRYAAYGDSAGAASAVAVGSITGLGTGVATALATNVSGTGAICLASGSACSGGGGSGALVLIEQHTASSSSEIDFTTCISSTYDDYLIELSGVTFSTALTLQWQASTDAGMTYDTTSGHYSWAWTYAYSSGGVVSSASDTAIKFRDSTTTLVTNAPLSASLRLHAPGSITLFKALFGQEINTISGGNTPIVWNGGGYWLQTGAMNAFRFIPSTGTFPVGEFRCYGVAKT